MVVHFLDQTLEYINGATLPLLEDLALACGADLLIAMKEADAQQQQQQRVAFARVDAAARRLMAFVRGRLLREEGVFRVSGAARSARTIATLGLAGSALEDALLERYDAYSVCDALKQVLRADCDAPVVGHELYLDLRMFAANTAALDIAVKHRLGQPQLALLHEVFELMVAITLESASNRLTGDALCVLLSPCVFNPPQKLSASETFEYLKTAKELFSNLYSRYLELRIQV